MNSTFSGLEKFGLSELLKNTPKAVWPKIEEELEEDINRYVWQKKFDCPCCNFKFVNWFPKEKRARLVKLDIDLRPIYAPIDSSFYDVIICQQCGYSALENIFNKILPFQKDLVLKEIYPYFRNAEYEPKYNVIHAIERYKMALLNCNIKSPNRHGEKGYIALKLSWFYKELGDNASRKNFANIAIEGLTKAMAEEHPPIMGMNYDTLSYIIGALAVYLGQREVALQSISKVMVSKTTSKQLKDMAITLKEEIKK